MTRMWLIGAGVVLGGLMIAAVVFALVEKADTLAEGSPEAAVQTFLLSLQDEDFETSYGLLSAELKQGCEIDEVFGSAMRTSDRLKNDRITLDKTTLFEGTALVTVTLTQFRGSGPFGASESSHSQVFSLLEEEGEWKFKEYPWPLGRCGPFEPVPAPAPLREKPVEPAPDHEVEPTPETSPARN